jgi:serine-type D-Ala-D-Ala carboxypeptidase (penicillin-binding protein 5/6)
MSLKNLSKKYLFYLSFLSFILVASFSLAVSTPVQGGTTSKFLSPVIEISRLNYKNKNEILPKNPVLKGGDNSFPQISARSILALDLDSMTPLYEKNPDAPLLPASTTKIVTALVAMDYYSDDAVITVGDLKVPGQNMGLVAGEKLLVRSILEGLLIYSGNDAAEVLAVNYPGGRNAFIEAMNEKAKKFHLENTHFENPTGFDDGAHYSTARDLTRIALEAMKNPRFSDIVKQKEKYVASTDGNIIHKLVNTNELLGEVPGVLGVKTGFTENARENLVTYMERDGHKVMIALLGSQDRFGETKEVINWVFGNYEWEEVSFHNTNP